VFEADKSKYLDFWNLMVRPPIHTLTELTDRLMMYATRAWLVVSLADVQFAGDWDTVSGNQAALFSAVKDGVSGENCIKFYHKGGAANNKIVLGVSSGRILLQPARLRDRDASVRPIFRGDRRHRTAIQWSVSIAPITSPTLMTIGVGPGEWKAGMWDYKPLPRSGAVEINNHTLGASYSYDK
jgi:chitinase